jgi:glucosamine-6-phosphate deaminase
MNIHVVKNHEEMSEIAAQMLIEAVNNQPKLVIGMATGGTPKRMYELLIEDYKKHGTPFTSITSFNLDEYVGLSKENPHSYYSYMRQNFFNHISICEDNINIPNGMAQNLEAECQSYEELIVKAGGIDLQILGIGENGHIGFNEPLTDFSSRTHIVKLTESTRRANAKYFNNLDAVPTHAISMGIATIMDAKEIILLAAGFKKAETIFELIHGNLSNKVPATVLKCHPNVTIIVDEDAYSKCSRKEIIKSHA